MLYHFGQYTLDPDRLELRCGDRLVDVEPQVFLLLLHLIANRERVVSKDELLKTVWNGRVVSDSTLNTRINAVRRAVGDNGKEQKVVRTFPRRGFRFVGDVTGEGENRSSDGESNTEGTGLPWADAGTRGRPVVAVLPFHDLDVDSTDTNLAFGLTDDLTTALGAWRSFPVIARNSCYALMSLNVDVREISRSLGAQYVIEGSARHCRDRLRVVVQLVDGTSGHCIWLERLDAEFKDLLRIQDEIAKRISATVVPEIEGDVILNLRSVHDNLDAWECYQHGMRYLGRYTKQDNDQARQYFQKALEIDTDYARGYSGLSFSYHRDVLNGYSNNIALSAELALKAALRAVKLDDADPLSCLVLGYAYFWSREPNKAIEAFDRTLELNPSDAMAHISLGAALDARGEPELAIPHLDTGIWLNPRDPRTHIYLTLLARAYLNAHRYEEAVEWSRKSIAREPENSDAFIALLIGLGHLGLKNEARNALAEISQYDKHFPNPGPIWKAYSQESVREHLREGLRKAGIKSIPEFR